MLKITKKVNKVWVTFSMVPTADGEVLLCGEWSDWKDEKMKVKRSGEYYLTKVLSAGKSYQFGYKTGDIWSCDNEVESVESPFGSKNSLLRL